MSLRDRPHEILNKVGMPFWRHFRRKRMARMVAEMEVTEATTVLDVGGSPLIWDFVAAQPHVTVLNLTAQSGVRGGGVVMADAARLPFRDNAFDLAFSNSVIEHLASSEQMAAFAGEVARVGRRYYVQTPSRWFPIEPHLMTPLIHYLPIKVQRRLLRNFTVWGWIVRPTEKDIDEHFAFTHLLTRRSFADLFPDAELQVETTLGLHKSFIVSGPTSTNDRQALGGDTPA